jgi:geranylgeranyl diphosphate synthase, type I
MTPGSAVQTAPAVLDRAAALVQPALQAAVARLDPELAHVAEYHLGWTDADGRRNGGAGGKGLRGALAVLSAESVGVDARVAVPGAAAVELVHNYSLLHDDVIDGDRERRHRPAVWALYGVGKAIIVGDALVNLALELLVETTNRDAAVAELLRANGAMIEGQAYDMAFESRLDVSVAESITMAARKTGALLSCAAAIGALLAGAPERAVAALRAYGRHLGLAFQAADDLLGIWGDPARTGKPRWSDLDSGKKSIPVAAALANRSDAAAELGTLLANTALPDDARARAADLVDAAGGRAHARRVADDSLRCACDALDRANLVPEAVAQLRELAHFAVEREH